MDRRTRHRPVRGTVVHGAQQTAVEYGVPSFVVSNTSWIRSKTKAPSFSAHGQIFFRESIPERYRGMVAPHEITHVMKQVQYPAYLDFVSKTPDMLDLSAIEAALLLENSAKHRGIDIFNEKGTLDTRKLKALSEADTLKLYDELNATLYGHIDSGKMEGLSEPLRHAFHDFDAYAKELTELHQRFKAAKEAKALQKKAAGDTMGAEKYSLKEDGVGGREEADRNGEIRQQTDRSRTEERRQGTNRKGETGDQEAGRVHDDNGQRHGGLNPSFGTKPYRTWVEEHVVEPAAGTVTYSEQQTAVEYGVPSFAVSDDVWSKGDVDAPAFSVHGQIYFRETIPESYRGMVAPHEVTHVMRQVEFAPYLDFVERTPTMLNMNDDYTTLVLEHIAALRGQTLDTIDSSILYDEFNVMMYGSIAVGNTNIFQNGKGSGMFHDFDAYAKELTELHERFKTENQKNSRFSLKAGTESKSAAALQETDRLAKVNSVENARFSLKKTDGNRTFVEVEEDILDGVPEKDWVSTVKQNLSKKFPNGITIGNNKIYIDKQSRREMTFSRYMQWLYNNDRQLHGDKLRATNNSDEILHAATDWVNEGLNHPRKDRITDFARGEVLLRVGSNDYTADVVVGTRKNGTMILYDVLNLQPTSFTEKETNAAISTNPSPGAARSTASVSDTSVSEKGENVNTNLSLKTGTITKSYEAVLEENRLLREQMKDYRSLKKQNRNLKENRDYWKGQTKTTKEVTTDRKAVEKAAAELLRFCCVTDLSSLKMICIR